MSTRLIIVRHGETESNVAKIQQGVIDTPLTEEGQRQILLLGKRLSTEKIDAVYSSDLLRAVRTTQAIIAYHPSLLVEYTRELQERDWGEFEGRSVEDYNLDLGQSGLPFHEHRPYGGENLFDLKQRVDGFLARILPVSKSKSILISTHHSTCKMMIFSLTEKPLTEWVPVKLNNTCVNILELGFSGKADVVLFNDISHLALE